MQLQILLPLAGLLCGLAHQAAGQAAGTAYGCDITKAGSKCCFKATDWANCPVCPSNAATASKMYGCAGELYNPANSPLMDWSYAGYMYGDYNPPDLPIMADIKTVFGAKGDGVTDDTAAFEAAIHTIAISGTVWIPEGTYVITRRLDIDNKLFLRGAGAGKSILYFPKSLQQVYNNTWANGFSQYTFGPGWINFNGGDFPTADTTRLATINGTSLRGSNIVNVNSIVNITVGTQVRVILDNVNSDLLNDLNARELTAVSSYNNRADVIKWTSKVTQVLTNPPRVVFERRLPFNISTAWRPELHVWSNLCCGNRRNFTGMSDVTIRFPGGSWAGENKDAGYNGIYMFMVSHSYIKNVVFENADMGIVMDGCAHNTVQNVVFNTNRNTSKTNGVSGSKGIWLKGSFDNLVRDFTFNANFQFEVTVSYFSVGNVFANGKGNDLHIKLLYSAAYSNLFTNINVGSGSSPFAWLGKYQDGSGYNAFWNIRTWSRPITLPPWTWAPRATFVNVMNATQPANTSRWALDTASNIWPYNLHDAQRAKRGRPMVNPADPVRGKGPGYGCTPGGSICCFGAGNSTCPSCGTTGRTPSSLFGCQGELWSPKGRLTWDWSYAGYQAGARPIPIGTLPVVANVKTQYGAKGDGVTDDTQAVLNALNKVASGVVYFPAGTYILKSVINIRKPIVLRGDGRGKTILKFPKSLTELYGNTWVEGNWKGTSQYSHGTGFINFGGWDPTGRDFTKITDIKKPVNVGDRVIYVANTSSIAVGQLVRMYQKDNGDGSLMYYLNGNILPITPWLKGYSDPCRFLSKVVAKGPDWIKLERPMPYMMRSYWTPQIHKFMPLINDNCGVESLTMSFPFTIYPGHFLEQGYNGLHMNQVVNGWIKDVSVLNSDMGVYLWGTVWTTVDNVTIANEGGSRGWFSGHRGIWLEHGQENLYSRFDQSVRFVHDISVSGTEQGTVFVNGKGLDINLDHHRSSPYLNLYTNLNLGWGARVFDASGDPELGSHAAMLETFWYMPAKLNYLMPIVDFAPNMTMVGIQSTDTAVSPYNWWTEMIVPFPGNLYDAMRVTRSKRVPA